MTVTSPDDLVQPTQLTEAELRAEFALALFRIDRLTLGQAALVAGLPQLDFQRLLTSRDIPLHYRLQPMDEDVARVQVIATASHENTSRVALITPNAAGVIERCNTLK